MVDHTDCKILEALQKNGTMSAGEIGKLVDLSESACSERIERLEKDGVIRNRVALLDPKKVDAGVTVFVAITTPEHSQQWLERFHTAVKEIPEVVEFYRMSGQVDYLLRVVVSDIESYDAFYKKLIATTELKDVSSTFAMEQIKFTTELPVRASSDSSS